MDITFYVVGFWFWPGFLVFDLWQWLGFLTFQLPIAFTNSVVATVQSASAAAENCLKFKDLAKDKVVYKFAFKQIYK